MKFSWASLSIPKILHFALTWKYLFQTYRGHLFIFIITKKIRAPPEKIMNFYPDILFYVAGKSNVFLLVLGEFSNWGGKWWNFSCKITPWENDEVLFPPDTLLLIRNIFNNIQYFHLLKGGIRLSKDYNNTFQETKTPKYSKNILENDKNITTHSKIF